MRLSFSLPLLVFIPLLLVGCVTPKPVYTSERYSVQSGYPIHAVFLTREGEYMRFLGQKGLALGYTQMRAVYPLPLGPMTYQGMRGNALVFADPWGEELLIEPQGPLARVGIPQEPHRVLVNQIAKGAYLAWTNEAFKKEFSMDFGF